MSGKLFALLEDVEMKSIDCFKYGIGRDMKT
jgi:hypothetical protein